MKSYLVYTITLLFLAIGCKEQDVFQKIRHGNFEDVEVGTYHGRTQFIAPNSKYSEMVTELCQKVDKNLTLLPMITRKFFMVTQRLDYKFKYARLDEERGHLILRYFARIFEHPVYAGYQVQLIFDKKTEKLVRVFTVGVPLE